MEKLTEEQEKDVAERMKSFSEEYVELTKKYQVDFATYPQYVPIGQSFFGTHIVTQLMDKKYAPVPSPITKESIIK